MPGNPDGLQTLVKLTNLPSERIKYLPDADEKALQSIERGILFLMAFWAGASRFAFTQLTEVISRLDPGGALEFVAVDVDGSPNLYYLPELYGRVHGYGESAWVRNGEIVAVSIRDDVRSLECKAVALMSME